jgi:hypothetical protein
LRMACCFAGGNALMNDRSFMMVVDVANSQDELKE